MNHPWFGDRPFLSVSAFSTTAFLDRWARGLGGPWHNQVQRFFERKRKQGVIAVRVFDETTGWWLRETTPHPFFNIDRSTSELMWDYNTIARPGDDPRPTRLTVHHQVMLLELIRLLKAHGLKGQLVVDATLKHTPGIGWKVIGHCVNRVTDFLANIHHGRWEDGADPAVENGMGSSQDPIAHERIRQAFEAVKGPLDALVNVETHNEWDQHAKGAWEDSGMDSDAALREVDLQSKRIKEEHWPVGSVGVSHGGRDDFDYTTKFNDSINIHPGNRPDLSWKNRFDHLRVHGKPIFLNEICHHISDQYWALTVDKGWFGAKSSTKDHQGYYDFVMGNLEAGLWVCDHSLVGMSDGYFLNDGEWHEMPLDPFEVMLGGGVEPPPPPPPGPKKLSFARVIEPAYREILGRGVDASGLEHYSELMRQGLSEADMRESLLRSPEYAEEN